MEFTTFKLKRRNIFLIAVLAFALMFVGDIVGLLIVQAIVNAAPGMSNAMFFTLATYLIFIGMFIIMPLYLYFGDKEVFYDLLPARRLKNPVSWLPEGRTEVGLRGNNVKMFLLGLLIGGGTNALCILPAWLHGDVRFVAGDAQAGVLLIALLCVFIQSSSEEFMMRYFVLGSLRRRYPVWLAIVFNAIYFMCLHLGNDGVTFIAMLDIAIIGVSYSIAVVYLDSLWMPMAMHTAWNFTQNYIFGLPNSGLVSETSILRLDAASASFFYDPVFGIEGTVISCVVDALLGVLIILYVRRKMGKPTLFRAVEPVTAAEMPAIARVNTQPAGPGAAVRPADSENTGELLTQAEARREAEAKAAAESPFAKPFKEKGKQ